MTEAAKLEPGAIAVTGLIVMEGVKLFRDLAPDVAELRRNGGDPAITADLRAAEMMTAGVMLLAGFSVSYVSGNSVPVWMAAVAVALVVGVAELTNAKAPAA